MISFVMKVLYGMVMVADVFITCVQRGIGIFELIVCGLTCCERAFWCCVAFADLRSSLIGAPTEERRFSKVGHSRSLLEKGFVFKWKKIAMGSMNYPIFTGKEVPEDWLGDYELFMLSMQVVNDEGKLHAIPLV